MEDKIMNILAILILLLLLVVWILFIYLEFIKPFIQRKPKTPLDKEIAEEEKEIKFLTEQKAKIDRLSDLKSEKDRLYQEVETVAQREDKGVPSCPQCGGTKVSYRAAYNHSIESYEFYDRCSDCGTKVNYKEWMN